MIIRTVQIKVQYVNIQAENCYLQAFEWFHSCPISIIEEYPYRGQTNLQTDTRINRNIQNNNPWKSTESDFWYTVYEKKRKSASSSKKSSGITDQKNKIKNNWQFHITSRSNLAYASLLRHDWSICLMTPIVKRIALICNVDKIVNTGYRVHIG